MCARVSEIEHEIASQPDCWRKAARLQVAELPQSGERVLVAGCGTSLYVAQAYAALREASGRGETDAFPASEAPTARSYDRMVVISRSGTTTEVRLALDAFATGARTVAITAAAGSPIATVADEAIALDFADERSVVQTRFATTALALLRSSVGQDIGPAIADGERAVAATLPVHPAAFDHFVFLGHGWTVGLANEAALKLREAAGAHAESYPAMEYRHGPISLAGLTTLAWVLGSPDPTVAEDVRATGATVCESALDPLAELVLVQRAAVALALAKGLDPDHPRHLTRAVVLSETGVDADDGTAI